MLIRLFYILDIDYSVLYSSNQFDNLESERPNDYTAYQIRSFAFAQAESIARRRLHRMDELKAVSDQVMSEDGYKNYKKLRKEIVGSHAIKDTSKSGISKDKKLAHNKKAAKSLINMDK